jgi:hypothetical protein
MKKNRGDESIGVIIHIYMELSQGNLPMQIALSQTSKNVIFFFFPVFFFSSTKSENRRVEQVLPGVRWGRGLVPVKKGRWQGKWVGE